jgi:acetate kinase
MGRSLDERKGPLTVASEQTILCLNVGSSSCKFSLYQRDDKLLAAGEVDRIGLTDGVMKMQAANGDTIAEARGDYADHRQAIDALCDEMKRLAVREADAVGHRVVHGGASHIAPERVTPALIADLERLVPYAPNHMPGAIAGMRAIAGCFPNLPQVACFDTAFHRKMPQVAERFALPSALYDEGLRRYGFHGISCEYLMHALGPSRPAKIVIAHLGNGASMTAVRVGVGIDTSMGLTPMGGFMMGTRSGDLDPGILLYLMKEKGLDAHQIEDLVDRRGGMLGVSGISSDMKTLLDRRATDPSAAIAIAMFCYQLRKQIGAFAAAMDGLDLLVFAGGIGERAPTIRAEVCNGLTHLGIALDPTLNASNATTISQTSSPCAVRVIPTNENLMIAKHTRALIFKSAGRGEEPNP